MIKSGIEIRRIGIDEGSSFTGSLTYSSLADFEANNLDAATYTALQPLKRMKKTSYFGYVQVAILVTPRPDYQSRACATSFITIFTSRQAGRFLSISRPAGRRYSVRPTPRFCSQRRTDFYPRIGIAWAPDRFAGHTVFRIGYGIYHEDAQLDDQNFPTANDVPRYSLARGTQFPNLSYPFDALLATATGIDSPKDQVRNRKDTYAQEWIASIQQTLPFKFVGMISAIGNKGTNIMNRSYINIINPATGLRPDSQFGQIELRAKRWRLGFRRIAVSGAAQPFSWLVGDGESDTWSHAINDGSLGSGVEDDFPEDVSLPEVRERSSSDEDARQTFSVSSVYELPFGRGRNFLHDPGSSGHGVRRLGTDGRSRRAHRSAIQYHGRPLGLGNARWKPGTQ